MLFAPVAKIFAISFLNNLEPRNLGKFIKQQRCFLATKRVNGVPLTVGFALILEESRGGSQIKVYRPALEFRAVTDQSVVPSLETLSTLAHTVLLNDVDRESQETDSVR